MINIFNTAFKHKKIKKLPETEESIADIVIKKIINNQPINNKDLQTFVNNPEYIEQKLRELTNKIN